MSETVERPEDLADLPVGTIVMLSDEVADIIVRHRDGKSEGDQMFPDQDWILPGNDIEATIAEIAAERADAFPAKVIYRPGAAES